MPGMESFVVRIWTPLAGDDELRGVVRHVQTGTEQTFTSSVEMAALLGAHLRPTGPVSQPPPTRGAAHR